VSIEKGNSKYGGKRNAADWEDKPVASAGNGQTGPERSYRYQGRYGWIMIGAGSTQEALSEARRSTDDVTLDKLQKWDGSTYVRAK
jgi:hypothetical protein